MEPRGPRQPAQEIVKTFCQACGAEHIFDRGVLGKKARCLSCGFVFQIPTVKGSSKTVKAFCQACGKEQFFGVAQVGKKVPCQSCGFVFRLADLRNKAASEKPPKPRRKTDRPTASEEKPRHHTTGHQAPPQQIPTEPQPRSLPPKEMSADLDIAADEEDAFEMLLSDDSDAAPIDVEAPTTPGRADARDSQDDELDQITALARAEDEVHQGKNEKQRQAKRSEPLGGDTSASYIQQPQVNPRSTVTALSVMLGLFYVSMVVAGLILLEALIGIVLTCWLVLPLVVVYGRKTLTHIAFLLTGRIPAQ